MGYLDIAQKIKVDIESGRLLAGAPLPPSRELAERLNVSRDTVVNAYRALRGWGCVDSDGRRGTFVIEGKLNSGILSADISQTKFVESAISSDESNCDFSSVPAKSLPIREWRLLSSQRIQALKIQNLDYKPNIFGRQDFRKSLTNYLGHARGIACHSDDVAIFNISIGAVGLLFRLLLKEGDAIAVEQPGYPAITQLAAMNKLKSLSLSVDSDGAQVELLDTFSNKPKLIYVTPDSHDPSGATLSLKRRLALLAWAKSNDAWIIEDAYDAWFRYGQAAPPSLKSLDTEGRVFYLSTFWQILYPLATTSYLVAPPGMSELISHNKALTDGVAETFPQEIIAAMLDSGFLSGHVRRWNKIFAGRRRALIFSLTRYLGKSVIIPLHSAGLHIALRFNSHLPPQILQAASAVNLPLKQVDELYLCSFAHLEQNSIDETVKEFAKQLGQAK